MGSEGYDTPDDLTLGEIWRTLLAVKGSVDKIEREIDKNWLSKEMYEVSQRGVVERVAALEGKNEGRERNRFALSLAIVTAFLTAVGAIVTALVTSHGGH